MHDIEHALMAPEIWWRDREDNSRSRLKQPCWALRLERMCQEATTGIGHPHLAALNVFSSLSRSVRVEMRMLRSRA